jgi:hypothetical protein
MGGCLTGHMELERTSYTVLFGLLPSENLASGGNDVGELCGRM